MDDWTAVLKAAQMDVQKVQLTAKHLVVLKVSLKDDQMAGCSVCSTGTSMADHLAERMEVLTAARSDSLLAHQTAAQMDGCSDGRKAYSMAAHLAFQMEMMMVDHSVVLMGTKMVGHLVVHLDTKTGYHSVLLMEKKRAGC